MSDQASAAEMCVCGHSVGEHSMFYTSSHCRGCCPGHCTHAFVAAPLSVGKMLCALQRDSEAPPSAPPVQILGNFARTWDEAIDAALEVIGRLGGVMDPNDYETICNGIAALKGTRT